LTVAEVEALRQRLNLEPLSSMAVQLTRADFMGAAGVFLLVFFSTFPVVVPLIVVRDTQIAVRVSNAVAVSMMFILGWSLGRYAGRPGWRSGAVVVTVGLVLVAITIALGG
jgi:VIT1/CCC1 family predicted Fe2+/Mn2+ transporter